MIETLKIIWKYLSEYKKDVYWISAMYVVVAALEIIDPYIFGIVVNSISKNIAENKTIDNGYSLWPFYVIITVIVIVIIRLRRYLDFRRIKIAGLCERNIALDINKHIISLPMIFHDNKKNGEILETISMARWNMLAIVSQTIFSTMSELITALFIIVASLFINYILTITIFAIIIALAYASQLKSDEQAEQEKNYMNKRTDAAAFTEDAIRNINTIKSFGLEKEIQEKYTGKYSVITRAFDAAAELAININTLQLLIVGMGLPIIFAVSSQLLLQRLITVGDFVTILIFAGLIFKPFNTLINNYYTMKKGMISIKEAHKLLTNEKMEQFEEGIIPEKKINGGLELKDVWFSYKKNEKPVFTGLSLKISPGEKVAIIGPNGGGKTSLIKLLQRFYEPSQGNIYIDGINIKDLNLSFERRCFAIVPQNVELFNDSILRNLLANPGITEKEIIQAVKLAQMGFVCEYVDGLNHIINEREKNISPGQAQRIAIARILLNDAPFVVLDEPTSAQDRYSEEEIAKLLKGHLKNKTVIIISHRSKPLEFVDRVFELKNGQITELKT